MAANIGTRSMRAVSCCSSVFGWVLFAFILLRCLGAEEVDSRATSAPTQRPPEAVTAFRNGGSGAYPDADPPLEYSATKNVAWRWDAPLRGISLASPIVVGDRLITLAAPLGIVCLNKHSGKELWHRSTYLEKARSDNDQAFAIQEAVRSAYRLKVLGLLSGKTKGGKPALIRDVQAVKEYMKGQGEQELDFFRQRIAVLEGHIKEGQDNREAYLAEMETLKGVKHDVGKLNFRYPCAAAPASDGTRIFAVFYPGLVVCCDLDGQFQWIQVLTRSGRKRIPESWGSFAEVPAYSDGKLLVKYGKEQFCFDAKSGKKLWQKTRRESSCAASPLVSRVDGVSYFISACGEVGLLESGELIHDTKVGEAGRHYQRALSSDGRIMLGINYAIRLPEKAGGKIETLWTIPKIRRGPINDATTLVSGHCYCAPVYHDGILYYFMSKRGRFVALDAATGKAFYEPVQHKSGELVRFGHSAAEAYADMILAGKHIFMFDLDGNSVVLKAGKEFGIVRRNPKIDRVWSNNPVFEGRRMYLRTDNHLFCFEKQEGSK